MELRRANPSDLHSVMTLEEAGFVPGIVEAPEVFAQRIAAFPEGFLLAEDQGQIWGYFCAEVWSLNEGEDPATCDAERFDLGHDIGTWLDRGGDTLYVASMTVAPAFRGGGRGRTLFRRGLERMVADFPALRRVLLVVNEHWLGARAIYHSEGFVEVGRLRGFFRPLLGMEGDAIVMYNAHTYEKASLTS